MEDTIDLPYTGKNNMELKNKGLDNMNVLFLCHDF